MLKNIPGMQKFQSPALPEESYTLTVSVLSENWPWIDKKKQVRQVGKDYFTSGDKIVDSDQGILNVLPHLFVMVMSQ